MAGALKVAALAGLALVVTVVDFHLAFLLLALPFLGVFTKILLDFNRAGISTAYLSEVPCMAVS